MIDILEEKGVVSRAEVEARAAALAEAETS
jgi:hypothetical protein